MSEEQQTDWALEVSYDVLKWMAQYDNRSALYFSCYLQSSLAGVIRESVKKHNTSGIPSSDRII